MGGLNATQKFARLFMFPGVNHCGGGCDPSHFDMVTAITAWVEHGTAPDKITAIQYSSDGQQQLNTRASEGQNGNGTQFSGESRAHARFYLQVAVQSSGSGKVSRTLPAYPMVPKFIRKGDVNDGRNYVPVKSSAAMAQDKIRWLGLDLFNPVQWSLHLELQFV